MILPAAERGSGETVAVLLHAGVADRRMWDPLLDALAGAGARAFAPDFAGFGEAELPATPSAPWQDVLDTLDAHGIERFVLVGNSFGALVAKRVTLLAPERVSALALISPPPEGDVEPSPQLRAAWDAEEDALEREELEAAVAAVVDAWTLPDAADAQRELLAAMQRRAFELQLATGGIADPVRDPLEEDPGAFARIAPRLVLAYGEHDMPDFRAAAEALAAELPDARVEEIAGAGHLAPLERPGAVLELLRGLLALPT